jgi:hypothetical protein
VWKALALALVIVVGFAAIFVTIQSLTGEGSDGGSAKSSAVIDFYTAFNSESMEEIRTAWPTAGQVELDVLASTLHTKITAACFAEIEPAPSLRCDEDLGPNDFYTPGGVTGHVTVRWTIEDGVIVDREVESVSDETAAYIAAFGDWLQSTYPETYESAYSTAPGLYPFDTVDGALAIVALVPSFVEQSSAYPLADDQQS